MPQMTPSIVYRVSSTRFAPGPTVSMPRFLIVDRIRIAWNDRDRPRASVRLPVADECEMLRRGQVR